MNAQIVKLFGLMLVLYAALIGFTSWWSVVDAEELRDHQANRRTLLEEERSRRGTITAGGQLLARSNPQGEGARRIYVRSYPQAERFAHAVGYSYVQRGRTGIERTQNDRLVGERPEFLSIIDRLTGRRIEGDDIELTLHPGAQRAAIEGLRTAPGNRRGAAVAIEPASGRVLAMASLPSYDPNRVPDEFGALRAAEGSPLLNRATQGRYVPGSTFKVVTAAAALDSGRFTPLSTVDGRSGIEIGGVPLRNFGGSSFGHVTLTTALTNSVNTVWAQVGEQLGAATLYRYLDRFGFNQVPPLDYPESQMIASGAYGEGGGLLDRDDPIDIGRLAIGQERLAVTPLQMAMVVAAIANDGKLMRPRLLARVIDRDGRVSEELEREGVGRVIKRETAAQLKQMMAGVVREGTGTAAALQGIEVGGKTGTAEVGAVNQAWFVGFAPVSSPRVAVAVTVERTSGQGGTVAAPIARRIMEELLR